MNLYTKINSIEVQTLHCLVQLFHELKRTLCISDCKTSQYQHKDGEIPGRHNLWLSHRCVSLECMHDNKSSLKDTD